MYMAETNNKPSNKQKGDNGEELAAVYLIQHGYTIVETKWTWERFELDIVAARDNVIVFVEVKTRYSNTYGEPWEAVNKGKRKRICTAADAYIQQQIITKEPRFDIISILKIGNEVTVQHIEEAFWPTA